MTEIKENIKKRTFLARVSRFLLKSVFFFIILLMIISAGLISLSQFKSFRSFMAEKVSDILNGSLMAEVSIDDIRFAGLLGLELENVLMMTEGDTLAFIPKLNINAQIEPIFNDKIVVNHLILLNPTIKILRSNRDSLWNYDKIAKPIDEIDTTDSSPFDFKILVNYLQIVNGNVSRYDSTINYVPISQTLSYDHIITKNFNLELNANINLLRNELFVNLRNINFKEENTGLEIKKLSSKITINPNKIEALNTQVETQKSVFNFYAEMSNFDVLTDQGNKNIENVIFNLKLDAEEIDLSDMYYFAEVPLKIEGKYEIEAELKGALNELAVKKIKLNGNSAQINMVGKIDNVLDMDNFAYNVKFFDSRFDRLTPSRILPESALEKLPDFGNAEINEMLVFGRLDTVFTQFDISSSVGRISGVAGSGFGYDSTITYSMIADFQKVNTGKILKDKSLKSNLSGTLNFIGGGTDLNNLYFDANVALQSGSAVGYSFSNIIISSKYNDGKLKIDSLEATLPRISTFGNQDFGFDKFSTVELSGEFDIKDLTHPIYLFNLKFNALDIAKLLNVNDLPNYLSGNVSLSGKGIHIDSIDAKLKAKFEDTFYDDKGLMPFEINAEIARINEFERYAMVESDFFNAEIIGKFKFEELINSLSNQGIYLASFIENKVNTILDIESDTTSLEPLFEYDKIEKFPDIDCKLSAEIFDLSPISTFIDSLDISMNTDFNISLYSHEKVSALQIDSIRIKELSIRKNDIYLSSKPNLISGKLLMSVEDSIPKFESFNISLLNGDGLEINDNVISDLNAALSYKNDLIEFDVSSNFNDLIDIRTNLRAELIANDILLQVDSAYFNYDNIFEWELFEPIKAIFDNDGFYIDYMNFARNADEVIKVSGAVYENNFDNLTIEIKNINLDEFSNIIVANTEEIYNIGGKLNDLQLRFNNSIASPEITLTTNIDSLSFNKFLLGKLNSEISHKNSIVSGAIFLKDFSKESKDLLKVDLKMLPYKVAFDSSGFKIDSYRPADIRINADNLPLDFASPFVPSISKIKGNADASFSIQGYLPDKIKTFGKINLNKANFLVDNLNIFYNASGSVVMNDNKIEITNINLRNTPQDNPNGTAKVNGYVILDGFTPGDMDIKISADRLLVLSEATRSQMPDLYGDFIISSGRNPINFYGTLDLPGLRGDINVNKAELKMIQTETKAKTSSKLEYIRLDDKQFAKITLYKDSSDTSITYSRKQANYAKPIHKNESNIADLINYDLSIKLLSNVNILMDLGFLGEMYAVIRTENRNAPINYVKNRNETEAKIFGSEIILDNKSTLKIGKVLRTSGKISFPKGLVQDPYLDISSIYDGTYTDRDNVRNSFTVKILLKGTIDNLDVSFTYFINGIEATGDKQQVESGALTTLLTGKPPEAGGDLGGNAAKDLSLAQASNLASKVFSNALGQSGVIQSAEIDLNSDSFSDSKVKVTGKLGDLNVSVGGSLQNIDESYEILIELPLSNYTENEFWRNWVIQLTRSTNNTVMSNIDEKNWEFKIKFGGSW